MILLLGLNTIYNLYMCKAKILHDPNLPFDLRGRVWRVVLESIYPFYYVMKYHCSLDFQASSPSKPIQGISFWYSRSFLFHFLPTQITSQTFRQYRAFGTGLSCNMLVDPHSHNSFQWNDYSLISSKFTKLANKSSTWS